MSALYDALTDLADARAERNASAIQAAIRDIPQIDFTEEAASGLIASLSERIRCCAWSHREHAEQALESLEDAFVVIDDAALAMRAECEAEEA